jgi:3-isopropylmalate/(R)-2-methylmalate dehydratase large subunit
MSPHPSEDSLVIYEKEHIMTRPMSISEKILAASAGLDEVEPGQLINSKIGLAYTMDFLGKVVFDHLGKLGAERVFDKDRVVVIFDHGVPAPDVKWADLHNHIRKEAKKYGVTLYDIGQHGMMHHVVAEEGHLVPGIVALGTDSHAPTGGAVGSVVMGIGATDIAIAMGTGELWLRVPEPVKVDVTGNFKEGVMARDIMTKLLGEKGWDGSEAKWTYRAIEFTGETIKNLNMDERFSLCNLVSDTGAKNAIIAPDETTAAYVKDRAKFDYTTYESDAGAQYDEEISFDVSNLEPMVACPHSPDNVKEIKEIEGQKINIAFLGTCANGRLNDLRAAAKILKGKKISPDVRLTVSPISQKVYKEALAEGIFNDLSEAGAIIAPSTCGPCYGGQLVVLGEKDVAISSGPRNMKGRMGSPDAEIYTTNPMVVAASAINGEITDPRKYL